MTLDTVTDDCLVVVIGVGREGMDALETILSVFQPRNICLVLAIADTGLEPPALVDRLEAKGIPSQIVEDTAPLQMGTALVIGARLRATISSRAISVADQSTGDESGNVDHLLDSLARSRGPLAVGVLLAGPTQDGTVGLSLVRASRGMALAQHEGTAPGGATTRILQAAAECADKSLSPLEIADQLDCLSRARHVEDPFSGQHQELLTLFSFLHKATGVDFSSYKPSTVRRRILKRMVLRQTPDLGKYLDLIRNVTAELPALYSELLVGVTELFRDPAVFAELESSILPRILQEDDTTRPIRVWVPGCSRGDEVYSIAICFLEAFRKADLERPLQIFATDLNEASLSIARAGRYPSSVVEEMSPETKLYFVRMSEGYQISRRVRELCVFARQDVTQDPPFSHLDLVSCRNLLIYLSAPLQRRALQHFHYALRPGGYLVLGSSESLGECHSLFTVISKRSKIFQRRMVATPPPLKFSAAPLTYPPLTLSSEAKIPMDPRTGEHDVQKQADRLILARYSPPGLVVDENFDIIQFRGRTGAYLEPPVGSATHNVLKMAREGLLAALRSALEEATSTQTAVRRENVQIHDNGNVRRLSLDVIPVRLNSPEAKCLLILFLDPAGMAAEDDRQEAPGSMVNSDGVDLSVESEILYLRHELLSTREYLNAIIQERESSNEELKAANEEAQSANEELQSANEELETAKEELQSTNEELATINEELHDRNLQLHRANSDLNNILSSVDMPVVILDCEMMIRRFTPSAQTLLNLIPGDIGRPFYQVRAQVEVPGIEQIVREVLDTLVPRTVEQAGSDGRWFEISARPYRTTDNRIDGAVLSFEDITELKVVRRSDEDAGRMSSRLLEIFPHPLALLDEELKVIEANSRFHANFPTIKGQSEEADLRELDGITEDLVALVESYIASDRAASEQHVLHLPGKSHHEVTLRKVRLHSLHHLILEVRTRSV